MSQIIQTRTKNGILYGLGGILLGGGLFSAVTWLGFGFRYGSLHIPDWICQVVGALIVLGSLYLMLSKSDVCSGCGQEIKDLDIYYKPEVENDVQGAFERGDFHGMIDLPGQKDYLERALRAVYGGCPGCGEAAYVRLHRDEDEGTRKVLDGPSAKPLSAKVSQLAEESED